MSMVRILFFSADPLSLANPDHARLQLDEEVRQIKHKVRLARYRDALEFDWNFAATPDDLIQGLHETQPQVVQFSGHGGSDGLVLASEKGTHPHYLDDAQLEALFRAFRGDIRLVVLSACFSRPQAMAIAGVVGCAIGTSRRIPDEAAIRFNAAFYQAVAFGDSVAAAFEKGRVAVMLYNLDSACLELIHSDDVDPAKLFLLDPADVEHPETSAAPPISAPVETPRPRQVPQSILVTIAALSLTSGGIAAYLNGIDPPPPPAPVAYGVELGDCSWSGAHIPRVAATRSLAAVSGTPADPSGAETALAAAKDLCRAGKYREAFPLFRQAANAGSAEAMGFLGIAYMAGEGTARQPELANHWLKRARDKRDARGMYALGVAYERGDGVTRNDRWARHWYQAAAEEKSYPEAMRNLARLYEKAHGDSLALVWLQRAAAAGSADAMVDLGTMLQGRRDLQGALRWYSAAARAGSARGMFALGQAYQDGSGVAQDYAQARAWYLRAVDAGSADAMNNLGVLYHNGWGVKADRGEANRWLRRARKAGSTVAAGTIASLDAR